MSAAAFLRPPRQPGLLLSRGQSNRFKILNSKSRGRVASTRLSFAAQWQAGWNLHVSDSIYGQLYSTPRKCDALVCQSFAIPSSADKVHLLETITSSLTRLCTALDNCPVVIQLAPAVGTIAFAIWGLGPLMRHGRHLFLRSGRNWKKSRTYYVCTSYLQPLLLWIGATLICKVLNPINFPSEASQAIKQRLLTFVGSFSTVLAFSYCLSNVIQQTQRFFLERNDSGAKGNMGFEFAGKAVYTAVWVAAISLFMELLGFSTHKWSSAGGLGTVLLTLAGREIFTNFLSSIMIHATRPFVVSERIQTKIEGYEVSGTVEHVGWWSPTIIRGGDREAVHIPNHQLTVNVVRNLSHKTHWRIKTHLAISHLDVNKINNIVADMRKVLAKNPQVEHKRLHRRVFLENINPENQALLILVSCFVKTSRSEEYLHVKEVILLDLLRVISHHRARLATPIRTVQKIYEDDAHIGAQSNRPLLLVETPRTNGNHEAKLHVSQGAPEERATKTHAASEPKVTSVSEGSVQNAYKLQHKAKLRDVPISIKDDPSAAPTLTSYKPQPEVIEAAGLGSKVGSKKPSLSEVTIEKPQLSKAGSGEHGIPLKAKAKNETARTTTVPPPKGRRTLEDNIILSVALEGSKQVLPIEGGAPTSTPSDRKELAATGSGIGSSSLVKDSSSSFVKDTAKPDSAAVDLRDKERGRRS